MNWKLQWIRRHRTALRRLRSADVAAVRAATESTRWRRGAGSYPQNGHPERAPGDRSHRGRSRYVFEVDVQIAGILRVRAGRLRAGLGPHPWSELSEADELLEPREPPCETLLVESLRWRRPLTGSDAVEALVGSDLPTLCRRLGAERLLAPVPISTDRAEVAGPSRPEALLQQIHHGSLPPGRLAPFLSGDYELRGFRRRGEGPEALAVWRHPRL